MFSIHNIISKLSGRIYNIMYHIICSANDKSQVVAKVDNNVNTGEISITGYFGFPKLTRYRGSILYQTTSSFYYSYQIAR